jgi:hypothetical protein
MKILSAIAATVLLLGACSDDAASLDPSLENLADIRSGELQLDVSIAPSTEGTDTGFSIAGVFSLPDEEGSLPEADLTYTQRVGTTEVEGRFLADGETVVVEVDGQQSELTPEQVDAFRATGDESADSVFGSLNVEDWFLRPETDDEEGEVTIKGDLDVIVALNDILEVAQRFGSSLPPIEGDEAEVVRESVRSATGEITTGAEDGLLHHVAVFIDFGVSDPDLARALGPLAGVVFTLEMTISNVNEPVDVD